MATVLVIEALHKTPTAFAVAIVSVNIAKAVGSSNPIVIASENEADATETAAVE